MSPVKKGKVYLVGAGPGDPGLITVRGQKLLSNADVILYDRLANPGLLDVCRSNAEKIFVGKEAGVHYVEQEDTIGLMINFGQQGKNVVRLKGGDPFIFGRGSEEAIALRQAGVEFEIVPGITAGIGASAYAGIPLTHRNMVTQCVFITAHESPDKNESQVDWESLAKLKNTTLVIYMGAAMIPVIVERLIQLGMDASTPAALVENATLPYQRTLVSELKDISERLVNEGFKPPLIFIIGPTANLRRKISWLERKPLFGKRIVVTRAEDQSGSLFELLNEEGAWVIPFSTIKTQFLKPQVNITQLLSENKFDWIIFTSENGVRYFFQLLESEGKDARTLAGAKIAAIGSGTAKKLSSHGIITDFIPENYTSRAFLEEFPIKENINGSSILRIKGDFTNDPLSKGLCSLGASVQTLEVYKIIRKKPLQQQIEDLRANKADAYLFTSTSTVENFFDIFGLEEAQRLLNSSLAVAIGPVTAEALTSRNIKNVYTAESHTIYSMVESLKNIL